MIRFNFNQQKYFYGYDIKQDLINKIFTSTDENLLLLLKADYEYFTEEMEQDITDNLSEDDKRN